MGEAETQIDLPCKPKSSSLLLAPLGPITGLYATKSTTFPMLIRSVHQQRSTRRLNSLIAFILWFRISFGMIHHPFGECFVVMLKAAPGTCCYGHSMRDLSVLDRSW